MTRSLATRAPKPSAQHHSRPAAVALLGFAGQHLVYPDLYQDAILDLVDDFPPGLFAAAQQYSLEAERHFDEYVHQVPEPLTHWQCPPVIRRGLLSIADRASSQFGDDRVWYDLGCLLGQCASHSSTVLRPKWLLAVVVHIANLPKKLLGDVSLLADVAKGASKSSNPEELLRIALDRSLTRYREVVLDDDNSIAIRFFNVLHTQLAQLRYAPATPGCEGNDHELTVNLRACQATLNGTAFALRNYPTAIFLQALLDAKGSWIGPKEICKRYPAFISERTDRIRNHLPPEINEIVEASPGKRCRIARRCLA